MHKHECSNSTWNGSSNEGINRIIALQSATPLAMIPTDNPLINPFVYAVGLEGRYEIKICLNIHEMNWRKFQTSDWYVIYKA